MQVGRREILIGLGHIGITQQRAKIADYLDTWFDTAEFVITSSKPKEMSSNMTILRPFRPLIWIFVATTIVMLIIILLTNDYIHLSLTHSHMGEVAFQGILLHRCQGDV